MKKVASVLFLILILCFATACGDVTTDDSTPQSSSASSIWDNATYGENTTLGNGTTQIQVEIKAEDKSVTLTVNTDKTTLSQALLELNLIEGEGGLYTVVNGMTADWNIDKTYWSLSVDGVISMVGADSVELVNGGHYEWTKTK